jgi:hypothetical protein
MRYFPVYGNFPGQENTCFQESQPHPFHQAASLTHTVEEGIISEGGNASVAEPEESPSCAVGLSVIKHEVHEEHEGHEEHEEKDRIREQSTEKKLPSCSSCASCLENKRSDALFRTSTAQLEKVQQAKGRNGILTCEKLRA